jgi:hypothetical protein
MNLFALCGFRILNFLLPCFAFFAFLLVIGSSLLCVYLEASNLAVDFSLGFDYSTSKPDASNVSSSLVFDYYTPKQATQTQCSWNDMRV